MQLTTQIMKFYTFIVSTLVLFIILKALFEKVLKISYFLISLHHLY